MTLADEALGYALSLGFDPAATLPLTAPSTGDAYLAWLAAGHHGEMAYMAEHARLRLAPELLAPGARSMIVLLASYAGQAWSATQGARSAGRIARYAWSPDYHDVLKARLFKLDAFLAARVGRATRGKACVDTAPLLERDFAAQAGLGFIGRNTCLITPGLGSWTFIAALLVPEILEARLAGRAAAPGNRPSFIGCGNCTRCLDACPTGALVADHVLDARRCISYLTIELAGPIPREVRPLMGDWVFGCDVCQDVCPYNRAVTAGAPAPQPAALGAGLIPLAELLALDEAAFRGRFRGTPVLRTKRRGLVRNACIAAGNSGDGSLTPQLIPLLRDAEPLVRGHAAWALARLGGAAAMAALREALTAETDPIVRDEIVLALEEL